MWPFTKRKTSEAKSHEVKIKTFIFSTSEAHCIGDWYRYEVEATSRSEAFDKLVQYFFGDNQNVPGIKNESGTVTYPSLSRFQCEGMPKWFAKRISGQVREDSFDGWGRKEVIDYHAKLLQYAKEHNITLSSNNY